MVARTKCAWCGAPFERIDTKRVRCYKCAGLFNDYKWYCKNTFKTSSVQLLIKFRNLCLDLKYNMPDAELLPSDLDYQFYRVTRYLNGELD